MPEYPEQSYYPGAKMRLAIRFDEFGQDTKLKAKVPQKTTKNLNGVKVERSDLVPIPDPNTPGGVRRFLLAPRNQTIGQVFAPGRSTDELTFDVVVVPKDASWSQNGIRTADTLNATIRYVDCPIDPRLVRSCAVEFYLGTLNEDDFAAGISGAHRYSDGNSFGLIKEDYIDRAGELRTNLRFQGWVDKWKIDWTDGEPYIHIECRDNTQLLIEQEVPSNLVFDGRKPLDEAIALYLSNFVQFSGLSVEYRPNDQTPPKLNAVLENTATRPKLGPQPGKGGGGSSKFSVWDYMTDVCGSIGHSIRVEGTNVIVQTVRSFTTNSVVKRADDPFRQRVVGAGGWYGGMILNFRRFIYGRNLEEMAVARNYAKHTPTNVEVRCYQGSKKQTLVARFPLPSDRLAYALPGDGQPDQKWTVIRVEGIKDSKTLHAVAQTVYESLGRTEFTIDLKTKNFSSFGGGNEDPDILDMKPGDTFELYVNKELLEEEFNTLTKIEKLITASARSQEFMKNLGFSEDFAKAYAKANTDAGYITAFRTKSMKVDWDVDRGVSFSIQGVNYIEVRMDKYLPQGEEPTNSLQVNAPNNTGSGI